MFGFTDLSNESLATTHYHYWESTEKPGEGPDTTLSHYLSRSQVRAGHSFGTGIFT